jgi:hypothetical protein
VKILLCPDVPGWAFDVNLRAMARYIPEHKYRFHYLQHGAPSGEDLGWCDAVFAPWHSDASILDIIRRHRRPVLSSLRSEWFDVQRRVKPTSDDVSLVNGYHGFHVVTRSCYEQLRYSCPRVVYLTNPVDAPLFEGVKARGSHLVAAWCGSVNHELMNGKMDAKGFYSIVLPACDRAGVRLVYSEYNTNRRPAEEMPAFYRRASVYLCASEYEGASNAIMEAMACGLYVICTDVGNHRELRDSGCSGMLLVPRTVEAFTEALEWCDDRRYSDVVDGGVANARTIAEKWSWSAWSGRYREFLEMAR